MKNKTIVEEFDFKFKRLLPINPQTLKTLDIQSFSVLQTYINSRECPHCHSHHVVSKGNYKNRKRYLCRNCSKSYNDLTNTPFSGIHHLEKIRKYLNSMMSGDSIRKAAEIVEVSVSTSFNWRHKLLNSFINLPAPKMKNVKEVIELKLPYYSKGQRKKISNKTRNSKISAVFICDRTGKLDSDSIAYSKREKNPVLKRIAGISNQHSQYICNSGAKELNLLNSFQLEKNNIKSKYSNSNLIVQTVETWQVWMKRFRGVDTKYLSNYLHWFDYLDNSFSKKDKIPCLIKLLLNH